MCGADFYAEDHKRKYCPDCAVKRRVLANRARRKGVTLEAVLREEQWKQQQQRKTPEAPPQHC